MSELLDVANSDVLRDGAEVAAKLERVSRYMFGIAQASSECQINFEWLGHNEGGRTIPFLDADIVLWAMGPTWRPELAPETGAAGRGMIAELINNPEEITGPSTVSYYLRTLSEYCLPPGTMHELGQKLINDLPKAAAASARKIQRMLRLGGEGRMLDEVVLDTPIGADPLAHRILSLFTQFAQNAEEVRLLEALVRRSTVYESLAGRGTRAGSNLARKAFGEVRSRLDWLRQDRRWNNERDAANIGAMVMVFNGDRNEPKDRVLPVLISRTQLVLELQQKLSMVFREAMPTARNVIGDRAYLVISEALLARTDHRYNISAGWAGKLRRDASQLGQLASKAVSTIRLGRQQGADWLRDPEVEIAWEELNLVGRRFAQEWQATLVPPQRAERLDHVLLASYLNSPEFLRRVVGSGKKAVAVAFEDLQRRLRDYRPAGQDFWELLHRYAVEEVKVIDTSAEPPFTRFFIVPSDAVVLSDIKFETGPASSPSGLERTEAVGRGATSGVGWSALKGLDVKQLRSAHKLRVAVLHELLSDSALLTVDSMQKLQQERMIRVTWLHECSEQTAWVDMLRLLAVLERPTPSAPFKYRLFPAGQWYAGEDTMPSLGPEFASSATKMVQGVREELEQLSSPKKKSAAAEAVESEAEYAVLTADGSGMDYFEMEFGRTTVFADSRPMADKELQAGVLLPASRWCSEVVAAIAATLEKTSLYSVGQDIWRSYLEYTGRHLDLRGKD